MSEPLLDDDFSQKDEPPIRLFSTSMLVTSAVLLFLGLIFKIQHWPMNALMILVGSGLASGNGTYRAIALQNNPVERAMRLFVPILALCILFFWLQYTLAGFAVFFVAAIIAAAIDHTKINK